MMKISAEMTEAMYVPNLREWQLGKLEGLKIATLEAIYPQQIKAFRSNLAKFISLKSHECSSLRSPSSSKTFNLLE